MNMHVIFASGCEANNIQSINCHVIVRVFESRVTDHKSDSQSSEWIVWWYQREVIRSRDLKDRQHNEQNRYKTTNYYLQNTLQKTKDRGTQTKIRAGDELVLPEESAVSGICLPFRHFAWTILITKEIHAH